MNILLGRGSHSECLKLNTGSEPGRFSKHVRAQRRAMFTPLLIMLKIQGPGDLVTDQACLSTVANNIV